MKFTKLMTIVVAGVLISMIATAGFAKEAPKTVYTVKTMETNVKKIEGTEITVEGTIVGACASGCKMWIADGQYEEGNAFTLVRAKDDAFKFDTKMNGKKVVMTGFVVAKYRDYCGDAAAEGKKETKDGEMAGSCAAPVNVESATKGELEAMTFFATTVKYLK